MTGKEAEETLGVIRTLMERSTCYTHLSAHAGLAAGGITLVGSALRLWLHTPFVATWIGVLFAAAGAVIYFQAAIARQNQEPLWTRQARTVVMSLTPAFISGLVLTAVLSRAGLESLLPGVWMLLWGVGALAMSFFTPRVISLLGLAFLGCGTAMLVLGPNLSDAASMGLTFGAIHLVYGIGLALAREPVYSTRPVSPS